jgi:hypothetical protein
MTNAHRGKLLSYPVSSSSYPVSSSSSEESLPLFHPRTTATRLYFSSPIRRRNDDDDKSGGGGGGGFLDKVGKAVKSVLPKKWFGSEEEKAAIERKRRVKDEVQGSVDEMLRGAPLGVRMMGKVISPLMGSVASTLAEGVAEQQRATRDVLDDARRLVLSDVAVADALGTPVRIGEPFSRSSSTTTVNGETQSRIELAMNVAGTKRFGVARVSATEGGIDRLLVESGGKVINVKLSSSSSSYRGSSYGRSTGGSRGDDNIIEAEIVDKETKR